MSGQNKSWPQMRKGGTRSGRRYPVTRLETSPESNHLGRECTTSRSNHGGRPPFAIVMRQRCANVRSELSGDQEGSREPSGLRPKSKNQAIHGVSKWPSRVGEFAAPSGAVLGSATGPSLGPSSGLGSDPGKARVPSFRSPMGVLPLGLSFDQSGGQLLAFWNEAPYAHPLSGAVKGQKQSIRTPPSRRRSGARGRTGGRTKRALVSPLRLHERAHEALQETTVDRPKWTCDRWN